MRERRHWLPAGITWGCISVLAPRVARADVVATPFDRGLSPAELVVGVAIVLVVSGLSWLALRAIRAGKK